MVMCFLDLKSSVFCWGIYGFGPENVGLIFPMIASHLVGIMISKTIGFFGVHNIFRQTHMDASEDQGYQNGKNLFGLII